MAVYEFICAEHGVSTITMPMAKVTASVPCPFCGSPSRRLYSAPGLVLGDAAARRLIEATSRSAHEPAVVSSPVGSRMTPTGTRPTADPRTARLPAP